MNKKKWKDQTLWGGHYPAVLTTDGTNYDVEFYANYHEWKANNTIIAYLSNSDSMPSFSSCEERRKIVKKGKWISVNDYIAESFKNEY
jgi:hypothetical protein